MSSAPHAHGPAGHDDHAFTGEPVQVLAADEPRTPGWLPLLGLALFTAAAVYALVGNDPEAAAAKADAAAVAEAPRPASPPQPSPPPSPPQPRLGAPGAQAGQPGPPPVQAAKITPDQMEKLRKMRGLPPATAPARGAH